MAGTGGSMKDAGSRTGIAMWCRKNGTQRRATSTGNGGGMSVVASVTAIVMAMDSAKK
jgi:hypothetical protein